MLQAKTEEQKSGIKKAFINSSPDICTLDIHFPDNDGIIVYGYVTFDQMAEIVDYLRSVNMSKKSKLDMSIVAPNMLEPVETWLAYKKEKAQTYKPTGFKTFYKKLCELSGDNPQVAMAIIEQSMQNNYAGIFPLKTNNNLYGTRTQSEKLRDTIIHANEFSQMLHDRIEQQATMGDGDSEEVRRLQDIL